MARKGRVPTFNNTESENRPIRFRRYGYLFLIVCEDQKTEPLYFERFKGKIPDRTLYLKTVGTGRDPKGVVDAAIRERNSLSLQAKKEVDQTWAVFDKDDADENETKIRNFESAFTIAEKEHITIAYSNEVFELWLLLHLTDVDYSTPLPRRQIYELLQNTIRLNPLYLNFEYKHGKTDIIAIVEKVGNQALAIERAESLFLKQNDKKPIEANPSTKVHLLVKELLDWINYYSQ